MSLTLSCSVRFSNFLSIIMKATGTIIKTYSLTNQTTLSLRKNVTLGILTKISDRKQKL